MRRSRAIQAAVVILLTIGVPLLIRSCLPTSSQLAAVNRIVDGDTPELVGGLHVRLIGIDTPELRDQDRNLRNANRLGIEPFLYEKYAHEAKEFVKDLALHQAIRLEYDPANQAIRHKDKYGRLLAYVWLESPFTGDPPEWAVFDPNAPDEYNFSLNASLVKAGYSFANANFSFKRLVPYQLLQDDARKKKRGFWQGRK